MRVFVISLPTSVARRESALSQLKRLGVDFEFFNAVDVRRSRHPFFHHYDDEAFFKRTGRLITPGEIGCFASHVTLWRSAAVLDEPIVVLEDDFEASPQFAPALQAVAGCIHELGFVRLENNVKVPGPVAKRSGRFTLSYCPRYPYGATAYAISPTVARRWVERSRVLSSPLDKFIKDYWRHGQPLHSIAPAVVSVGALGADSTIAGRTRAPLAQFARLRQKLSDAILRSLFNTRHRATTALHKRVPTVARTARRGSLRYFASW